MTLWPGLVLASLSKGWVILQPIPWQELCHQPAEKRGFSARGARVSARSYREIHLCDFDMLPWFLLGWFLTATIQIHSIQGKWSAGPSVSKLQLCSPTC